jgi:hypothetical protein
VRRATASGRRATVSRNALAMVAWVGGAVMADMAPIVQDLGPSRIVDATTNFSRPGPEALALPILSTHQEAA